MRIIFLTVMSVLSCLSFSTSAASIKIKWIGVVPSLDCASRPITNQTNFETLNQTCHSEFKIEAQQSKAQLNEPTQVNKNIVSLDV